MAEVKAADSFSERLAVSAAPEQNVVSILPSTLPSSFGRVSVSLNKLRFSSLGLYGRDREVSLLRDAYRRVRESATTVEMVLISGDSGTGKSSLMQALCRIANHDKTSNVAFCASGKFDLHKRSEPLSGLISALSQICDDIISLKDTKTNAADTFTSLRDSIQAAVGSEVEILIDLMPKLRNILGERTGINKRASITQTHKEGRYDGPKTKVRFKFLIRRFFRAICCPSHPLVLLLDDLQWADPASFELIEMLATDNELSGLLIVCCFRNNEVGQSDYNLSKGLREIEKLSTKHITSTKIVLRNLDVNSINDLIADVLCSDKDRTHQLAKIVHEKTLGNPFFAKQFLITLRDNGLLFFCIGKLRWQWDEEKIKAGTDVADNIVDLLKHKMQTDLSPMTRNLLEVAACLGSAFDEAIIFLVMKALLERRDGTSWCNYEQEINKDGSDLSLQPQLPHADRALECLESCVSEGFLDRTKNGAGTSVNYRFVHDQIQLAAFSLIPENEREMRQLHIGEALLQNLSAADLETNLFVVVDLCNSGVGLVSSTEKEKALLSNLNLRAGVKAIESSAAFIPASEYLNLGITLLGPKHWVEQYDLSLALFSTAAEVEFCNGNYVLMQQYIDEVLAQPAVPFLDKYSVYCTLIRSLSSKNRFVEATNTALDVLKQLGVNFPKFGVKLSVMSTIKEIDYTLKKRSIDSLIDLPVLRDEIKIKAMGMMDKLSSIAYSYSPDLSLLAALKLVQWSVRYFFCLWSPNAFAILGSIHCFHFCDLRKGHEYGKLALSLSEKLGEKKTKARVLFIMHATLFHWVNPLQQTFRPLFSAYEIGMESGDVDDAMTSIVIYLSHALTAGRSLSLLKKDMEAYHQQMGDYEQERPANCILTMWQLVLNLTEFSDNPTLLTGEVMDQDVEVMRAVETNQRTHIYLINTFRMWLACYFQDYRLAWQLVVEGRSMEKYCRGLHLSWRNALFEGLAAFSLARKTKSIIWKSRARKVVEKVQKWTKKGNVNCAFCACLFEAENYALAGKNDEAKSAYDVAIRTAAKYGLCNDKALATERAGEFFIDHGDIYRGTHYLSLAHQLYLDWGARAKADKIMEQHSNHLSTVSLE